MRMFLSILGRAIVAVLLLSTPLCSRAQTATNNAGLLVTYTAADAKVSDVSIAPNVWLYVPAGKTPSPFLSEGKFTAVWEGFVAVDLRGDFTFEADLNGSLKLEINGNVALEASSKNGTTEPGKSLRLNKGTNAFKATFTSADAGDSYVRLRWKPRDSFMQPIPLAALSHSESEELKTSTKVHLGRELFLEHRCAKCHTTGNVEAGVRELSMDAPQFDGIGSRRTFEWMSAWIADPKSMRGLARMPKVLHGANTQQEATAIAAYLASLKTDAKSEGKEATGDAEAGKKLFQSQHCTACHNDPATTENDISKISLKLVGQKFAPGALVDFLKQPNAHYKWIRMPVFKLSDGQRTQIAAFLIANSEKPKNPATPTDAAVVEQGKKLVQTSGCLNCHTLKLDNQFTTKSLADLKNFDAGCLSEKQVETSKAPNFQFVAEQREALKAFLVTDHKSLMRHVPSEFAERQVKMLNCRNCHEGQVEGIPHFELIGGKLKPEWSAKFIGGNFPTKMRPWLDAQMPAFVQRAEGLAQGLAMEYGYPPQTPAEPAIDQEAAKMGNRLVSAPPLGFGCIQCHSIGSFAATQVFEAPGVNLIYSGERLQSAYFHRWLRNPPSVDPATKMPVYFDDEGKSPLTDIYEGDGAKQIEAVWQYLRLGEKMPPPQQPK